MDHFFKHSPQDKCTLGADKVLINRRNLITEVKRRVSATKSFLLIELKARIVAATMEILEITSMDEASHNVKHDGSKTSKKK